MKGISNEEGITFADLIDFVDNNRSEIPGNFKIKLHTDCRYDNETFRDVVIDEEDEEITFYNYI